MKQMKIRILIRLRSSQITNFKVININVIGIILNSNIYSLNDSKTINHDSKNELNTSF